MLPMSDFMVRRDDLRESRIARSEVPELEPGQALLRVDSFGLTANNITYAALGEAMSYWDFFPASWHRLCRWVGSWLEVARDRGFEAVQRTCLDVLDGRVDPRSANVLSLDRAIG